MKDSPYFTHDSNAASDRKTTALLSVYGFEGYGWFWRLAEMMRDQEDFRLPLAGKYTWKMFADVLRTTEEKAQEFILDCINEFELFASDGETFWSERLLRNMEHMAEKSEKQKVKAEKRWDKAREENATAMPRQCHGNATAMPMQCNIKEKEKEKVNIKEEKITPLTPLAEFPATESASPLPPAKPTARTRDYPEDFDKFWDAYPARPNDSKGSKKASCAEWRKLTPEQRQAASECLPAFTACRKWREGFSPDCERYLKQRHFESPPETSRSAPIPITSPRHVSRELTHEEFLASMPPGMRERTLAAEKAAQEETACAL